MVKEDTITPAAIVTKNGRQHTFRSAGLARSLLDLHQARRLLLLRSVKATAFNGFFQMQAEARKARRSGWLDAPRSSANVRVLGPLPQGLVALPVIAATSKSCLQEALAGLSVHTNRYDSCPR